MVVGISLTFYLFILIKKYIFCGELGTDYVIYGMHTRTHTHTLSLCVWGGRGACTHTHTHTHTHTW